jgi:beta-lactamase class D
LPLSTRSQAIVADIIKLENKGERVLYGKTGWSSAPTPQLGWFVGWVENERGIFSFALNMDMASINDAKKRKLIAKALLDKFDIY